MGNCVMDVVAILGERRSDQISGFQEGGFPSFCVGQESVSRKGGRMTGKRSRKGLLNLLVGVWILVLLTHGNFPSYVGARLLDTKSIDYRVSDTTGKLFQALIAGPPVEHYHALEKGSITYRAIPYDEDRGKEEGRGLKEIFAKILYFNDHVRSILNEALRQEVGNEKLFVLEAEDFVILIAKQRQNVIKSGFPQVARNFAGKAIAFALKRNPAVPMCTSDSSFIDVGQHMIYARGSSCDIAIVGLLKTKAENNPYVQQHVYAKVPIELLTKGKKISKEAKQALSEDKLLGAMILDLPC